MNSPGVWWIAELDPGWQWEKPNGDKCTESWGVHMNAGAYE